MLSVHKLFSTTKAKKKKTFRTKKRKSSFYSLFPDIAKLYQHNFFEPKKKKKASANDK